VARRLLCLPVMRLVIEGERFRLEDVPDTVDLSEFRQVRGMSWTERGRRLTFASEDASAVRDALARRGVHLADHEVRAATERALADDPVNGPALIAAYGDERAVSELARALDEYAPHLDCAVCDYLAVLGLGTAIAVLGGAPTEPQRRKMVEYERRQRGAWSDGGAFMRSILAAVAPLARATSSPSPRRLGRNDPCHCGSGKKYKTCHLDLDRATLAMSRQ
jgi:hypothetical protein